MDTWKSISAQTWVVAIRLLMEEEKVSGKARSSMRYPAKKGWEMFVKDAHIALGLMAQTSMGGRERPVFWRQLGILSAELSGFLLIPEIQKRQDFAQALRNEAMARRVEADMLVSGFWEGLSGASAPPAPQGRSELATIKEAFEGFDALVMNDPSGGTEGMRDWIRRGQSALKKVQSKAGEAIGADASAPRV